MRRGPIPLRTFFFCHHAIATIVKLPRLLFPALLALAMGCARAAMPAADVSAGSSMAADDRDETALTRVNAPAARRSEELLGLSRAREYLW